MRRVSPAQHPRAHNPCNAARLQAPVSAEVASARPPFQPRRFGFGSGLAAGLLGAGLFGMLTGNGFFGGLDGLTSIFGLLFQLALLAGLALMAMRFLRARSAGPAYAGAPFGATPRPGSGPAAGAGPTGSVPIGPSDFDAFEATLVDVQTAYSREDMNALSRLSTSEMVRSFANDLGQNRSRGLHNDLSDPKAPAGRPFGGLAGRPERLRDRSDAVQSARRDDREEQRPDRCRGPGAAERIDRTLDVPPRRPRPLAAVRHSASRLTSTPQGFRIRVGWPRVPPGIARARDRPAKPSHPEDRFA